MRRLASPLFVLLLLVLHSSSWSAELTIQWQAPASYRQVQSLEDLVELATSASAATEYLGHPSLPLIPVSVAIPAGDRVISARFADCDYSEISWPGELPAFDGRLGSEGSVGGLMQPGGTGHVVALSSAGYRGLRSADLLISPFQCESKAGRTSGRLLRRGTLVLETAHDPTALTPLRMSNKSRQGDLRAWRGRVVNPEDVGVYAPAIPSVKTDGPFEPRGLPSTEGSGVEMVIITSVDCAASFQQLAEYKTSVGIPTVVRDVEWICQHYPQGTDLQETIRFFLQDALENWGMRYVLLAGDTDLIPIRYAISYFMTPPHELPTDLYYAQLDGNWNADGDSHFCEPPMDGNPGDETDFVADVFLGRLPVSTPAQAELMVDKIITYSETPDTSYVSKVGYFGEVLFPADWQIGDPDEWITRNGASYCENVRQSYQPEHWEEARYYETYWLYEGSAAETVDTVTVEMENRAHLIHHVGHGYRYNMSCGDGSVVVAGVMELQNGLDHLFNIFAMNCTTCAVDYNCLGDAFLLSPEGGAISVVGATREAFPNTIYNYQNAYFEGIFGDSLTIGELFTLSHNNSASQAATEGSHRWTQLTYILIGDPSIRPWGNTPYSAEVTMDAPYTLGSEVLSLTVSTDGLPVESLRVTALKDGEAYASGLTDAGGQVDLALQADSPGEMEIHVVGGNCLPWHGSIEVLADNGPRLSISSLLVADDPTADPDISGNGDGVADAGETIRLNLTIANNGDVAATDVSAQVSVPGLEFAFMEDSLATGQSIAAGDSLVLDLVFLAQLSGSLYDGIAVPLQFDIGCGESAQSDEVDLLVSSPLPSLLTFSIDDSAGDADGEPDAGETYHILPEWKNYGSTVLDGWQADLILLDGDAAVISGSVPLPALGLLEQEASGSFIVVENDVSSPNFFEVQLSGPYGELVLDTLQVRRPVAPDTLYLNAGVASTIVDLYWDIPDENAASYLVYKSLASGGPYELASTEPIAHAYFRATGLEESTTHYFVAESVDSFGFRSATSDEWSIATNPAMLEGWPLQTTQGTASSLVIGDIDGDGDKEVVAGSSLVHAWHHDGGEVIDGDGNSSTYGVLSGEGDYYTTSLVLAQVDTTTAGLEVVAMSANTNEIYVFRGDGSVLEGWPVSLSSWCWATPAVDDVDGDGLVEIFAISLDNKMWAWHADGTEVVDGDDDPESIGVFCEGEFGNWSRSSPAIAQMDEDPELEIIVCTRSYRLRVFDPDGSILWSSNSHSYPIYCSPSIGDLDEDGDNEVVFTCENDSIYVYHHDGARDPNFPVFIKSDAAGLTPSPALTDFEGDGQLEIVTAGVDSYTSMSVTVLDNQGNAYPGWPIHLDDSSEASPVVADLDDDEELEILLGTEKGYFYAWELDGSLVDGFPILTGGEVRSTPTVDDIDDDFSVDVALMGWDSFVYIWDMPGFYRNGLPQWRMFRSNLGRTGLVTREDQIVGVDPVPQDLPPDGLLYPNWPNPFNPVTTIRLLAPQDARSAVRLEVFDLQGRLVRTLFDGYLEAGQQGEFTWNGRDEKDRPMASGVYFARARMGSVEKSRKMLLLK